ncbi:wolframin [Aplochiton taeniatus]
MELSRSASENHVDLPSSSAAATPREMASVHDETPPPLTPDPSTCTSRTSNSEAHSPALKPMPPSPNLPPSSYSSPPPPNDILSSTTSSSSSSNEAMEAPNCPSPTEPATQPTADAISSPLKTPSAPTSISTPTPPPSASSPTLHPASPSSNLSPAASSSSSPPSATPTSQTPAQSASSSPGAPTTRRFAAVAKRVLIQERLRKVEEEEAQDDDEEPEEDLPFKEMLEKAKAGDARAQTSMGRHYLKLAEEEDEEVNNGLAVDWLIQAAKQGRKSAARTLQRCWIQRKGITEENEQEVRKLSTESKFEQAVRKAAMMMYFKLNPDRKKRVAMSEMMENVGQVNSGQCATTTIQTQKILESMVTSDSDQFVDLDDFVEITKKYAQGIAPSSTHDSIQNSPQAKSPTPRKTELVPVVPVPGRRAQRGVWGMGRSGAMKRAMDIKSHFLVLQYPIHAIIEMKENLVDWASRAGVQWLSTVIPTHHVNALIFFFIISNLTVDLFAFVIPLLVFYLSFVSMVICTLRVFQSSKGWDNFSALTALLTRFEPGLDVEQAESNFGWNNLEPYLYFIMSVFFVIFSFPVADKGWIPCSELSTVAIFFTVVSYMSLSPSAANYARRALVTEVASSLCGLTRFLPERMFLPRLLGRTFAALPLGNFVVLKLSLPCLLYVYLFYLFFKMAVKRGFRGTYCFLVPYLVCFMWCEFSVVLLQNSSPIGLIRTCVAYFLFLFALPVLTVGLAAMLLIQLVKWFLGLELTKMLVTLAVCAVPVTLRLWTRFSLSILDVFRSVSHRGAVKIILCCVTTVILVCWLYVTHSEGLKVYNSALTWGQYGRLCGPPAWRTKGVAQTQTFCSHLDGHRVTWTGRFKLVRVKETENGAQSVINMLPAVLADWLRCLYGQKYPRCEARSVTAAEVEANLTGEYEAGSPPPLDAVPMLLRLQEEEELCEIKAVAKHTCHVKRFDSYVFEVLVGMLQEEAGQAEDPARDIALLASHEFKQVLLNLDPGQLVEFSTKLEGRLGEKVPAFELKAIHCLDCSSSPLTGGRQVKIERNWRQATLGAMKFAFDFFFSPFLSAKIDF